MKRFFLFTTILLLSVVNGFSPTVQVTSGGSVTAPAKLGIGISSIGVPATTLEVAETGTGTPRGILSGQYNTGTDGARVSLRKARGTRAAPTTIVTGDIIGSINAWGYDSANYLDMSGIDFVSSGTIAATRVPTEMRFYTATDALPSVKTLRLTIGNSGVVTIAGNIVAGNIDGTGRVQASAASGFEFGSSRGKMRAPANGVFIFSDDAVTGFTTLQLGPDAATPSNVSLKSGNGSGTDKNGGNIQITPGLSTGAGVSGTFSVWTAGQGSTGAALNTATNRFEISALGEILFPSTVTAVGTTATQTINKPSGRINVAAAASNVTVNNSLCTTNSLVFVTVATNDGTATIKNCVSGTGSFVITLTAAATAETRLNFFLINQ